MCSASVSQNIDFATCPIDLVTRPLDPRILALKVTRGDKTEKFAFVHQKIYSSATMTLDLSDYNVVVAALIGSTLKLSIRANNLFLLSDICSSKARIELDCRSKLYAFGATILSLGEGSIINTPKDQLISLSVNGFSRNFCHAVSLCTQLSDKTEMANKLFNNLVTLADYTNWLSTRPCMDENVLSNELAEREIDFEKALEFLALR